MCYVIQVTIIRWRKVPLFPGGGGGGEKITRVKNTHKTWCLRTICFTPLKMYAWSESTNLKNKTIILSLILDSIVLNRLVHCRVHPRLHNIEE